MGDRELDFPCGAETEDGEDGEGSNVAELGGSLCF